MRFVIEVDMIDPDSIGIYLISQNGPLKTIQAPLDIEPSYSSSASCKTGRHWRNTGRRSQVKSRILRIFLVCHRRYVTRRARQRTQAPTSDQTDKAGYDLSRMRTSTESWNNGFFHIPNSGRYQTFQNLF